MFVQSSEFGGPGCEALNWNPWKSGPIELSTHPWRTMMSHGGSRCEILYEIYLFDEIRILFAS